MSDGDGLIARSPGGDPVAGTVEGSVEFDPFGVVTGSGGVSAGNIGFQGAYTDPVSKLVDMGARWYSPGMGRFVSRDTIRALLGTPVSLNMYTYANNDPLGFYDPDGHDPGWAHDRDPCNDAGYYKCAKVKAGKNAGKKILAGYGKRAQDEIDRGIGVDAKRWCHLDGSSFAQECGAPPPVSCRTLQGQSGRQGADDGTGPCAIHSMVAKGLSEAERLDGDDRTHPQQRILVAPDEAGDPYGLSIDGLDPYVGEDCSKFSGCAARSATIIALLEAGGETESTEVNLGGVALDTAQTLVCSLPLVSESACNFSDALSIVQNNTVRHANNSDLKFQADFLVMLVTWGREGHSNLVPLSREFVTVTATLTLASESAVDFYNSNTRPDLRPPVGTTLVEQPVQWMYDKEPMFGGLQSSTLSNSSGGSGPTGILHV